MTTVLSFLAVVPAFLTGVRENLVYDRGGVVRMDTTRKEVFLVFTGHEFADGGDTIRATLREFAVQASFFFTGDFYRRAEFAPLIKGLHEDGHCLGPHSDRHLLYASWEDRDSLLVARPAFDRDLEDNLEAMAAHGIPAETIRWFVPPFEWYNDSISVWTAAHGIRLVNFSSGTSSNADYTIPSMGVRYVPSDTILARVLRYEATSVHGLNGFLLLLHIGTHPDRTDKMYCRLGTLIRALRERGYSFRRLP
jgi:peptidoglycan/xylan/chitin deacetylase (PgdA/CDA1 family)